MNVPFSCSTGMFTLAAKENGRTVKRVLFLDAPGGPDPMNETSFFNAAFSADLRNKKNEVLQNSTITGSITKTWKSDNNDTGFLTWSINSSAGSFDRAETITWNPYRRLERNRPFSVHLSAFRTYSFGALRRSRAITL